MLSIIIPAYNAENTILNTLKSVVSQKTGFEFEIIVMDNGSKDSTVEVTESFLSNYLSHFKVIKNPKNLGLAGSINAGVKESDPKNNFVMILHSDIVLTDNKWLDKLIPYLKDDVACVTSPVLLPENVYADFGFWEKALFSWEVGDEYNHSVTTLNYSDGKNDIFRKDIYLRFGGYDGITYKDSCEDVDLSKRLQKAGYKIISVPSPVSHLHSSQSTGLYTILFWKNPILSEGQGVLYRKYQFIGGWNNQIFKTLAILMLFIPFFVARVIAFVYIATIIFGGTYLAFKKINKFKVFILLPPVKLLDYILNLLYFWRGFITGKQRK
ncbi:Glycosyltransferase AglE [uncultured archaeon]|nr:Glycosyltransferase AglE [uncultured archaeon]